MSLRLIFEPWADELELSAFGDDIALAGRYANITGNKLPTGLDLKGPARAARGAEQTGRA